MPLNEILGKRREIVPRHAAFFRPELPVTSCARLDSGDPTICLLGLFQFALGKIQFELPKIGGRYDSAQFCSTVNSTQFRKAFRTIKPEGRGRSYSSFSGIASLELEYDRRLSAHVLVH